MLLVFLTTLASFGKTGDDPINLDTFEIVVLPADTSMGEPNVVQAEKGQDLDINWISRPKHGYEVDHWVSKKGLTLYNISDDDTIIVYFKKMQMYTITVISNDTTRGTVTGSGDYIDGEKVYLEHYAKEGSQFDYWYSIIDSTRFGNRIWAYRNDTIVGKFIDASATPEVGDKPCQVVVLSADTTQGTVGKDSLIQEIGTFLYIDVYPKYGYVFDHWYSVKGLPTNRVSGNDTIIAYFKELPKHNIVFVSNDTLKGYAHGGNGLYPEGKIMQTETSFYPQEQPLLYGAFPGYHFAYWETNMGNLKTLSDYYVTANDTITLHFENDTIPEGYLNIYLSHIDSLSLYGNIAISNRHNTDSDSIIVTNKSTGKTDTLPITLQHKYNMNFGDTLLLSIKTSDGYVSDSIYTLVYDDSSSSSLDKEISLHNPMKIIELEDQLNRHGLKTYFHISPTRSYMLFKQKNYKPVMPYDEYIDLINSSHALINIVPNNQSNVTLRDMESVFNSIKCITNNLEIEKFELYDPSRFFIIGKDDMRNIKEFIYSDYKKVEENVLEKYKFTYVINEMIHEVELSK